MTMATTPTKPSTTPNAATPASTVCTTCSTFDVQVRITKSILTPLSLEEFDHSGWKIWKNDDQNLAPFQPAAGAPGREEIAIEIEVLNKDAERLTLEIVNFDPAHGARGKQLTELQLGGSVTGGAGRQLTVGSGAVEVGRWIFFWDGYIDDKLDTKMLKDSHVGVRVTGSESGVTKDHDVRFNGEPFKSCAAPSDWVDVVVDRANNTVEVEWRVQFDDKGNYGTAPATTTYLSYDDLIAHATAGISKYWSRSDIGWQGYSVNVKAIGYKKSTNPDNVTPSISLQQLFKEKKFMSGSLRSVNSSCACGSLLKTGTSLLNLAMDTTIIYYNHYYQNLPPNNRYSSAEVGSDFEYTAAHELGHAVLASYAHKDRGRGNYSWVHKGNSAPPPGGNKLIGEKGGEAAPESGELDLMKYYTRMYYALLQANGLAEHSSAIEALDENGNLRQAPSTSHTSIKIYSGDIWSRGKSSPYDVRSLIWLSRVHFGEAR